MNLKPAKLIIAKTTTQAYFKVENIQLPFFIVCIVPDESSQAYFHPLNAALIEDIKNRKDISYVRDWEPKDKNYLSFESTIFEVDCKYSPEEWMIYFDSDAEFSIINDQEYKLAIRQQANIFREYLTARKTKQKAIEMKLQAEKEEKELEIAIASFGEDVQIYQDGLNTYKITVDETDRRKLSNFECINTSESIRI